MTPDNDGESLHRNGAMTSKLDQKFLRAVPWTVFDGIFNAVYAAGMVLLLGRFVSPAELGLAGTALAVTQLLEATYLNGLQESAVRARSSHTALTDTAHTLTFLLALAAAGIACLLAPIVARIYGDPRLFALTMAASLILPFNALFSIPTAILTRKMRASVLTRRMILAKLFALLALATTGIMGLGAWSVVLSSFASSIGSFSLIALMMRRWPRFRFIRAEARALFRYSIVSSAEVFTWMATTRAFILIFGFFHGMAALGALQFAFRLVDELATLLQSTTTRLGLAYFSGLQRAQKDIGEAYLTGIRLLNTVAAPIYAGLAMVATDFIPLLFGSRWDAAVPFIWVLAGSWIIGFPRSLLPSILKARGRPDLLLAFGLFKCLFVLSCCALTGDLPPIAAVIGWAMVEVFAFPWTLFVVRREIGLPLPRQFVQLIPALIATAGMVAAIAAFSLLAPPATALPRMAASIGLGIFSYVLLIALLDRAMIRKMVDNLRKL